MQAFLLFAGSFLITTNSSTVQAQDPLILSPNIIQGDIRNIAHISLATSTSDIRQLSIRVLDDSDKAIVVDDVPVEVVRTQQTDDPLTLDWDTRKSADGQYKVEYAAIDSNNRTVQQRSVVNVINKKPLVTLNQTIEGREIAGTVSRKDISFIIKADSMVLDAQPIITDNPSDDQTYIWKLIMPTNFANGAHTVAVTATPLQDGTVSDTVLQSVTLTDPPASQPAQPKPAPVITLPPLPFVQQIGQFIAPLISPETIKPQTKFFGVPVTDIVPNSSVQNAAASSGEVLGAQSKAVVGDNDQQHDTKIVATPSGWQVLGIAWYWWALFIVAIIMSFGIIRYKKPTTAHSVQA